MVKVLVVDDDPDVRALLSVWLRGNEFQLIFGVDGYQAVQLARTRQPDIILLDINLPAAKGFVVHDRLKHISSAAMIPIVYISADGTAEAQALQTGAAGFLVKPLDKDRVLTTLRQVSHQS